MVFMRLPCKTISLFILVLLLSLGVAAAFDVQVMAINDTILPFESATYLLTFTGARTNDVINIRADASNWIITPQSVGVGVNTTEKVELIITPRSGVGLSNYLVPLVFESARTNQVVEKEVYVYISVELLSKGYPPNVKMVVNATATLEPRDDLSVSVFLKNNNLRDIQALDITVRSDLFEQTFTTPLAPLSSVRKALVFDIDDYTPPGTHDLAVILTMPDTGKTLAEEHFTFAVEGYADDRTGRVVTEKGLFTSTEVISVLNDGNRRKALDVSYEVSSFEDVFLKAEPKGTVSEVGGERQLVWEFTLDAQEEAQIVITRNYWPLVIVILALVLATILYFVLRSPLVAIKEGQVTSSEQEGAQELKIRLFVKNRSRKEVSAIKIIDRVPHIAEFITHAHLGTLQPSKVTRSEKRGTIIRWEIESLEPFEERIISYKIRCKLKVIGQMSLPPAKVRFDNFGRERVTASGVGRIVG